MRVFIGVLLHRRCFSSRSVFGSYRFSSWRTAAREKKDKHALKSRRLPDPGWIRAIIKRGAIYSTSLRFDAAVHSDLFVKWPDPGR